MTAEATPLWVAGVARIPAESFEVTNPSTGKVFTRAPACGRELLDEAVEAAHAAIPSWQDPAVRIEAMLACAETIKANAEKLGRSLATEMGKPIGKAIEEAFIAAFVIEANAALPLEPEVVATEPSRVVVHRRPLGVVAAISPWNWPLGLSMWKVAPAWRAGNTVVLKPSPYAPMSSLLLGELLSDVLPKGVFSVLSGGDDVGRMLVDHSLVRKVGFTGSVETGLAIASACAKDLKRFTLEMGGNDAAIVLGDANIGSIAESLFWAAFQNSGQVCSAIKRIYVHEDVADELIDALCERASRTIVGDPFDDKTELGPIANRRQLERIESLLDSARRGRANIRCGGERLDSQGFFYAPTIVTDIGDGEPLVSSEQFGPVLPVMRFTDIDDALSRANTTHYGLGGSVWTADGARGGELAGRLEVGTAWVNQHFVLDSPAPFGGWKHSGIGRENGMEGLHAYTELQVVSTAGCADD